WSAPGDGKAHSLTLLPEKAVDTVPGSKLRIVIEQLSEREQHTLGCFRITASDDLRAPEYARTPVSVIQILGTNAEDRSESQRVQLTEYYLGNIAPELKPERDRLAELKKELRDLKPNTVPIMHELSGDKRRKTHLQFRGNFLALGDE